MAKSKKAKAKENTQEDVVLDKMPGADAQSEVPQKFEVDLNFGGEEEPTNEEVKEENDTPSEEEAPEEGSKTEDKEEGSPEPEVDGEEGVDENSEAAPQPDLQSTEGSDEDQPEPEVNKKQPMVPKSRLDEVLVKQKALKKQLDDFAKAEEAKKAQVPDFDFTAKESEYQQLVLDGESQKATEMREEIRNAERAHFMSELEAKMGQTVQQSQEMTELQQKALEIQEQFPVLDENSANFDEELQGEVLSLRDAFIAQGYTPGDALARGVEYTLAAKKPELLASEQPSTNTVKKTQELKNKQKVSKKLEAADSQPPALQGESTANKPSNSIDINKLSDQEFNALPEETLRRMRGDFG